MKQLNRDALAGIIYESKNLTIERPFHAAPFKKGKKVFVKLEVSISRA